MTSWTRIGTVTLVGTLLGGCGFLEDRFKTCQDTPVELINSDQTLGSIHLLAEGESATAETLLRSGQTRRVFLCLDRGQSERFRAQAENDPQPVAASNCVATQSTYESARPRVLWTPVGLRCEGW